MTTQDVRVGEWSLLGPAGMDRTVVQTWLDDHGDPVALGTVSAWLGGEGRDLDDFTGAAEVEAVVVGNVATLVVPFSASAKAQRLRLTLDGQVLTLGSAHSSTRGTDSGVEEVTVRVGAALAMTVTVAALPASTVASLALADTAVQPGDLGTAAAEDVEAFDPAGAAASALSSAADYTDQEILENGSSGRELDSAESDAVQTGITTVTDLTGLSITFTVGARPVWVTLDLPYVLVTAAGAIAQAQITDAAGTVARAASFRAAIVNHSGGVRVRERIATPGTYTRKARLALIFGTGSCTNNFDATTVATLVATEH